MVAADENELALFFRRSLEYMDSKLKYILTPEKHCQITNQIIMTWLFCLIENKTEE